MLQQDLIIGEVTFGVENVLVPFYDYLVDNASIAVEIFNGILVFVVFETTNIGVELI